MEGMTDDYVPLTREKLEAPLTIHEIKAANRKPQVQAYAPTKGQASTSVRDEDSVKTRVFQDRPTCVPACVTTICTLRRAHTRLALAV
jgi:hypothetical protein